MKIIMKIFITMVIITALSATVFAIHETQPAETQLTLPGASATDLYTYIMKLDPYRQWELWPGKGKLYKGTEPHGSFLTTYVNGRAYSAAQKKTAMSDGAIIVKENYTADKTLSALTVLYKIKGYNPEKGDWFWARYELDGKATASGKVDACIACHESRKDNDYIFTGPVK
jgi:hypothetical protein